MRILFGALVLFIFFILLHILKYTIYQDEVIFIIAFFAVLGIDKFITDLWVWLKDNDTTISKKKDGQESKPSS